MPASAPGTPGPGRAIMLDSDISFIFSTGRLEIVRLPETSPWAEKYNAAAPECACRILLTPRKGR